MANSKIDELDLQILQSLQSNSKLTNLKLSQEVGLSPAPTLERVKKLERKKVIRSYHAVVDPKTVGLQVESFVMVNLDWNKKDAMNAFVQKIADIPEIMECHRIVGEADCILRVLARDLPSYEDFVVNKLAMMDEVKRVNSLLVLSTAKMSRQLPLDYPA
jgi:Lrp/AsnC family leucine-responsive transcriptional regulator